jgi:hypothetical protein
MMTPHMCHITQALMMSTTRMMVTTMLVATWTTTAPMGVTTTAAAAAAPSLAHNVRQRGPLSFLFVLMSHPPTSSLMSRCLGWISFLFFFISLLY